MQNRLYKFLLPVLILIVACSSEQSKQQKNAVTFANDSVYVSGPIDTIIPSAKSYLTDCKKLFAEAKKMDSTLLTEMEVKNDVANKAIKAFTDFAFYCTEDTLCAIYLIKTAQVAQAINNSKRAKIALDKCVNDYPKSTHRPAALFLLAQLYDEATQLNNETEAKKLYEKIIAEYPKSDWAKSAKGALNFIGKTDEQIMEEFKKK
ncbi:MAG: tetratricopeptide repeat protein [Bacteroidetes bacterium]|nr:tetratricopeptide repeat protein [Bacteroidota bacterium]